MAKTFHRSHNNLYKAEYETLMMPKTGLTGLLARLLARLLDRRNGVNNRVMGKRNTLTSLLNNTAVAAICVFTSLAFGITDQERRTLEKQQQDGVVVDNFNYSDTKGPDKFKTTQPEFLTTITV